jgi:hypothetical protein
MLSPLTNYNVFVLDQRFRKNSSVSFVNTNVTRNGSFKDANVSALIFDLNTIKIILPSIITFLIGIAIIFKILN